MRADRVTKPDSTSSKYGLPAYQWPEGKSSAFTFSVDVDAEAPWLWANRNEPQPNLMGQLEQRRFGPRVGIWRILDLLDRYGIKGSFYVPACVAELHPELLPAFVARGHEIGLHGYFHELVAQVSDQQFSDALGASLELFDRQTGIKPAGFRSPAWELTPHMLKEIRAHGLYDSSLSGFDHPYTIDGVTEIPVQWAIDDAIYFKFLGGGNDHWPPVSPQSVYEIWQGEWQNVHRFGGLLMLTIHDWISGRGHRIHLLERLLDQVTAQTDVWIATSAELAAWHSTSANQANYQVAAAIPEGIATKPKTSL